MKVHTVRVYVCVRALARVHYTEHVRIQRTHSDGVDSRRAQSLAYRLN